MTMPDAPTTDLTKMTGTLPITNGGTGNSEGIAQGIFKHCFGNVNLNELYDYTLYQISGPVNAPETGAVTLFSIGDKRVSHSEVYSPYRFQIAFMNNKLFTRIGSGSWTQI